MIAMLQSGGVQLTLLAPRSRNLNAFAERWCAASGVSSMDADSVW